MGEARGVSLVAAAEGGLDAAYCLRRLGRRAEAEAAYRALATPGSADPRPLAALAEMAAEMARHDEAISLWRRALALAPGEPSLLLGLGDSLFGSDRHLSSIAAFGRALAATGTGGNARLAAAALMGMAGARARHGEGGAAVSALRRALATYYATAK